MRGKLKSRLATVWLKSRSSHMLLGEFLVGGLLIHPDLFARTDFHLFC